jgi:superfamily II DNA helicase RecQ
MGIFNTILSTIGEEFIQKLSNSCQITLLAVDEAHCVSQWGHDFRPAYKQIGKIRRVIPNVPILAVTATATINVRHDIIQQLKLR